MQSTISPSNCQQTSWLFSSISDKMEAPGCNKRNTLDHPLTEMMFLVISGVLRSPGPTSNDIHQHPGHGSIETSTCRVIDDLTFFDDYKDWPGITGLIRTESHGEHKNTGKVEQCNRYYISSKRQMPVLLIRIFVRIGLSKTSCTGYWM